MIIGSKHVEIILVLTYTNITLTPPSPIITTITTTIIIMIITITTTIINSNISKNKKNHTS